MHAKQTGKSLIRSSLRCLSAAALLLALLPSGCARTDPAAPISPPPPAGELLPPGPITVTPDAGSVLTGTITFNIQSPRADAVAVSLFDVTLAAGLNPLTWDSRTIDNGRHTFRFSASNAAGEVERRRTMITDNIGRGVVILLELDVTDVEAGNSVTIAAQVLGATDRGVQWSLPDGLESGTITPQGVYTAPTVVSARRGVTILATSVADPSVTKGLLLGVKPAAGYPVIELTPASSIVLTGSEQRLNAVVTNSANSAVTWEIANGGPGSISSGGVYRAPSSLPAATGVTIVARSVANPASTASAHLSIREPLAPGEAAELEPLFHSGFRCAQISDQLVDLAADMLNLASRLNGNQVTRSGTITRTGAAYTIEGANQQERLIVILPDHTLELTVIEATALRDRTSHQSRTLAGSGVEGIIRGRLLAPGIDVSIDHASSAEAQGIGFTRTIRGDLAGGPIRHLDITDMGTYGGEVAHIGSSEHRLAGNVTTDQGRQIRLDEELRFGFVESCYAVGGNHQEDWLYRLANTIQLGPFSVAVNGTAAAVTTDAVRKAAPTGRHRAPSPATARHTGNYAPAVPPPSGTPGPSSP